MIEGCGHVLVAFDTTGCLRSGMTLRLELCDVALVHTIKEGA
jgi:hypothetical protein